MALASKKDALILFVGDISIFLVSVWLALYFRYFEVPDQTLLFAHLVPFGMLSLIWILVFFIAGLYEKQTLFLRSRLPNTLFNAQVTNLFLAIVFFYFLPQFGINPKTNLFIYLVISSSLIFIWRLYGDRLFSSQVKQKAIIIGNGEEIREIKEEVNNNPRYHLSFIAAVNLEEIGENVFNKDILQKIYSDGLTLAVVDFDNKKLEPILAHLYNLIFSKIRFIDMHNVYEDIFDRVPLSLLKHSWFLENISISPKKSYIIVKRAMDILIALVLGIVSLVLYPFVYLAIKLDDGRSTFFIQERIGQNNTPIKIVKFRTMSEGEMSDESLRSTTRVGEFLRKTRIDELPQLWNVIKGDISLIGPRPEVPNLVSVYEKEIAYYNVRHLVKPGLSGWGQIKDFNVPRQVADIEKTKNKLSYDLYYIKNRSLILDFKIALKTIKTLLSKSGV